MKTNEKTNIITRLENLIADELKPIDREARFDEMLDECYSFEKVGGPFACMSPSAVLKECDPTAYRCGVNDYADSEAWVEIDGDYYEQSEAEEIKEKLEDELDSEDTDLSSEIDEAEEDGDVVTLRSLSSRLAEVQADLATLRKYSF